MPWQLLLWLSSLLPPSPCSDAVVRADVERLPPVEVCRAYRDTARIARDIVHCRETTQPVLAAGMWEARCQAQRALDAWELAAWARSDDDPSDVVRHLSLLRGLIGPQAFYSGRLPPPIPLWAFPRCD